MEINREVPAKYAGEVALIYPWGCVCPEGAKATFGLQILEKGTGERSGW